MNSIFIIIFLIFVGQILGSLLGLFGNPKKYILYGSLAFAGSMMLAVSFFEILPEALKVERWYWVTLAFFLGVLIMWLVDRLLPHINPELCKKEKPGTARCVYMLVIGIALHNLPEGLAIGSGFALAPSLGIAIALAIASQDIPENLATITPLYHLTKKRLKSFLITTFTILFELVGFLIAYYFLRVSESLLGLSLAIAAGFMVYLSVDELIPNAKIKENPKIGITAIILGLIVFFLTTLVHSPF